MRLSEILNLTIGAFRLRRAAPRIAWIGKGRRPRQIVPGPQLIDLLRDYLGRYERGVGRPLARRHPAICRGKPGGGVALTISWGNAHQTAVHRFSASSATHATAAGLGHLSPHDLRRSAAGILHRAKSDDGAHYFDLLDIQRVLGHTDPATTMRSYLEPIDTATITRAADFLD